MEVGDEFVTEISVIQDFVNAKVSKAWSRRFLVRDFSFVNNKTGSEERALTFRTVAVSTRR